MAKKKRKRKLGQSGKNDGKTNGLKMKKARVPRGVRKLRGCITCGIDKTLTQEQWDEHEAKFHLGLFQSILLLISAELKPRGY